MEYRVLDDEKASWAKMGIEGTELVASLYDFDQSGKQPRIRQAYR